MSVAVAYASADIMSDLRRTNAPLVGRCFENCVIAVLGLPAELRLQYVLGFMTPPGHKSEAHAWLLQEGLSGPVYLDPTLQDGSKLWQIRSREFIYDERFRMTKTELKAWFRTKYPDRKFDDIGVPEGSVRLPRINAAGDLE
ncbi:hypothetical protein LPN04_29725 [Rugamonas sp. A1-17]|nr:hypothetical protein [Rugamonas sp. A1-17]